MENNTLDTAVNILGIMHYLYTAKGLIDIRPAYDPDDQQILLEKRVFKEIFPGVEAEEGDSFLRATYKGVKVVACL